MTSEPKLSICPGCKRLWNSCRCRIVRLPPGFVVLTAGQVKQVREMKRKADESVEMWNEAHESVYGQRLSGALMVRDALARVLALLDGTEGAK